MEDSYHSCSNKLKMHWLLFCTNKQWVIMWHLDVFYSFTFICFLLVTFHLCSLRTFLTVMEFLCMDVKWALQCDLQFYPWVVFRMSETSWHHHPTLSLVYSVCVFVYMWYPTNTLLVMLNGFMLLWTANTYAKSGWFYIFSQPFSLSPALYKVARLHFSPSKFMQNIDNILEIGQIIF